MALPFINILPHFSKSLEHCLDAFKPDIQTTIRRALLDDTFPAAELEKTSLAQPALFALEYALAKSLIDLGLTPTAIAGHSIGEITAACLGDTLDLANAARFATARGKYMQTHCPEGAMLALSIDAIKTAELITRMNLPLHIAAINTHESCVVAGTINDIENFQKSLSDEILSKRLKANRAFHSPMIEPAIEHIENTLQDIIWKKLKIPLASNTQGNILPAGTSLTTQFFVDQARHTVKFANILTALHRDFPNALLLEIGPGKVLTLMAKAMRLQAVSFSSTHSADSNIAILKAVGALWTAGCPINLSNFYQIGRTIHLPTYPFFGPKCLAPEAAVGLNIHNQLKDKTSLITDTAKNKTVHDTKTYQSDEVATVLTNIWKELLNYDDVNKNSDFFELGGNSLLIVGLIRKVNDAFQIQTPPRTMIAARTLCEQAKIIHNLIHTADPVQA